jgi:hypothetical protein
MMTSFDLMPRQNANVVRMATHDMSGMKGISKQTKALAQCNASRVQRSEGLIKIEFLDMNQSQEKQVRLRFYYQLTPPFRRP